MSTSLNPYLHFDGNAHEAMSFYADVFGAEMHSSTFGEAGGMGMPESDHGKIMHAQIDKDGGPFLMGSDLPGSMPYAAPAGFTISLSGDDEATLTGWWERLSEGGTVHEPLMMAPWGDKFGMLTDRFGVPWLVNITGAGAQG